MLALSLLLPQTLIYRKLKSDFIEAVAAKTVVIMAADVLQCFRRQDNSIALTMHDVFRLTLKCLSAAGTLFLFDG